MPSNFTQNYQLSQWEATDQVCRTDFNSDNAKIDGALKAIAAAIPQIYVGRYTGNGTYGVNHPNVLTFPFPPKLVIVSLEAESADVSGNVFIRGQTACSGIGYNSGGGSNQCLRLTWSGNTLSWYTMTNWAYYQMNTNGTNYCYFAIG